MSPKEEKESWNRYQKVVLSELSNHTKALEEVAKSLKENSKDTSDIKISMAEMKATVKLLSNDSVRIDCLENSHATLSREVGENKISSGLWGSVSGAITGVITALTLYFTSGRN